MEREMMDMRRSLFLPSLACLFLLAGCSTADIQTPPSTPVSSPAVTEAAPAASPAQQEADALAFVPSMGCYDQGCADSAHYHHCDGSCAEAGRYHDCPQGCTHEGHHRDAHHSGQHHS